MDIFFWVIVIAVVLSAVGGVIWWLVVILVVGAAVRQAQRNLNSLLPEIERMLQQAQNMSPGQLKLHEGEIVSKLMQARSQMSDLDGIHRARYENRMGELMGVASQAGIDWTPPPY